MTAPALLGDSPTAAGRGRGRPAGYVSLARVAVHAPRSPGSRMFTHPRPTLSHGRSAVSCAFLLRGRRCLSPLPGGLATIHLVRWMCSPADANFAALVGTRPLACAVARWLGQCGKAWHRRGDGRGCSLRKLGSRTGRGLPRLPRPHWCVSVRTTSHATCQGNSRATCHSLRARNTTRRSRALGCLAASWRHGSAYLCSVTATAVQSTRQLVQQMGGACGGPSCRTAFRYSMRPTLTARTSRLSGGRAATYPTGALVGVETPRRKTRVSSLGVLAAPTGGAHPSTGSWRFWRTSHSSTSPRSAICPAC